MSIAAGLEQLANHINRRYADKRCAAQLRDYAEQLGAGDPARADLRVIRMAEESDRLDRRASDLADRSLDLDAKARELDEHAEALREREDILVAREEALQVMEEPGQTEAVSEVTGDGTSAPAEPNGTGDAASAVEGDSGTP